MLDCVCDLGEYHRFRSRCRPVRGQSMVSVVRGDCGPGGGWFSASSLQYN